MSATHRGIFYALMAASIYGLVPNIARHAFEQGIPALESVVSRTIVVVVILGAFTLVTGGSFHVPKPARAGLALQVLATVMVSSCYIASIQFIPVGIAVLIFFTFPVIIALASPVVEGHAPAPALIALAVLAFAGLAIAIGPQFASLNPFGLVLAALSALGCALQFFSGRMLAGHVQPAPFAVLVHLAVLPVVTVLMLWTGDGHIRLFATSTSIMTLVAVGLVGVSYCAAYFCQMSSVAQAPASVVAPYFNLEPVVTTLVAALVLGEELSNLHVAGGVLVLVAILLTGWLQNNVRTKVA